MPQTNKVNYNTSRTNRIEEVYTDIINAQGADDKMEIIIETLSETEVVPEVGRAYTFVYNAKTPGVYDEFPLVAVTEVKNWGFQGINFHWGTSRNYTWNELIGFLHVIQNDEIDYLRSLSYANFKTK